MFRIPLRLHIPLLLLLFGLVAIGFGSWVDLRSEFAQQERDRTERLLANGARLAGIAQYFFGKNDFAGMDTEMKLTAAVPDLRLALLCDAEDRILLATESRWRNQLLADSALSAAVPLAARARKAMSSQVNLVSDGRSILGAFPYQLRTEGVGVVIVQFDLTRAHATAWSNARRKALWIGAGLLALCLLLWGELHYSLTARVRKLMQATRELTQGNLQARAGLKERDELGDISLALDKMADEMSQQVRTLQNEIAERKQAEVALQENRAQTAGIIESAMDAIISVNEAQRIVLFNAAAEKMFGATAAEAIGQPLDRFIPERYRVVHRQYFTDFSHTNMTKRMMGSLGAVYGLRENGEEFPIEASISQIESQGQKLYTVILRDITERKEAEARLIEQAALLNQAREAIISIDLQGRVLFWNRGAELIYGWAAEEAMGAGLQDQLFPGTPIQVTEARTVLYEKGEWTGELRQTTKDGCAIVIESRMTLVLDEARQPKSILVINTDITEQKRLEAQFLRAQRLESIGTLASGIAHDLNNVLTPVLMSVQLLQVRLTDEASQRILDVLHQNVVRGSEMVKQVLSFARGSVGERVVISPKHLIKEIINILHETFPKNIAVKYSVSANLHAISGDPTQIHQALMNLCVNARDALATGGTLTIEAENKFLDQQYAGMMPGAQAGPYVVIAITDTGTGIPPEVLDKIFDPFFTTKELGKGTGLGLSTVMGIVRGHGGFVNVYSEVGKGTKFHLYLPALVTSQPTATASEPVDLPTGHGELILVVEDEAAIREVTQRTLEAFGYRVLLAGDGTEAITQYAAHQGEINLVLTDLMMPYLDGPATIRALRKINPAVQVIASSGLTDTERSREAESLGVTAFLTKPYTAQELLQTLAAAPAMQNYSLP